MKLRPGFGFCLVIGSSLMFFNCSSNDDQSAGRTVTQPLNAKEQPVPTGKECATPDPGRFEQDAVGANLKTTRAARLTAAAAFAVSTPAVVSVRWHVIHSGATGQLSASQISDSIDVLNASYTGQTGGAATRFTFALASADYTDNADWYAHCHQSAVETAMKSALRQGGAGALNVYSCGMIGSGYYGWSTYPWWYADYPIDDGVVIWDASVPGGGGCAEQRRRYANPRIGALARALPHVSGGVQQAERRSG